AACARPGPSRNGRGSPPLKTVGSRLETVVFLVVFSEPRAAPSAHGRRDLPTIRQAVLGAAAAASGARSGLRRALPLGPATHDVSRDALEALGAQPGDHLPDGQPFVLRRAALFEPRDRAAHAVA